MSEVIAFDIGGTNMRAALVREHKIIKYLVKPTPKDKQAFLQSMEEFIEQLMTKNTKGIGVGIASPIKEGVVLNAPNLGLKNYPLQQHLEQQYKKKVVIDNDASCFTKAVMTYQEKNVKNFILLTIGTGIGGGIVINKEPYRGTGLGGEFGHMYIRGKDWESQWKMMKKKIQEEFGEGTLVSELCKKPTPQGDQLLEETADLFGEGIASLITSFDPEIVVIGGGIEEAGTYFMNKLKPAIQKYMFLKKTTPITWTTVEKPGIIGASLLIDHKP